MENTNLTRKQQKIFAGNTTTSEEQIAVFGSKANTGTMEFSKDPDVIQNEYYIKGWQKATLLEEAPLQEDFNAIDFVESYNLAYLFQKGIPEYSENTTYFKGSICSIINSSSKPSLYYSLTDNNIGNNPTTDDTNWANLYSYISSLISDNFALIDGSNVVFNNLSTNAKDNIIQSVFPSYNTETIVSDVSFPYTATYNCWFSYEYAGQGNTGTLWVNGVLAGGGGSNSTFNNKGIIPINNGDIITSAGTLPAHNYIIKIL